MVKHLSAARKIAELRMALFGMYFGTGIFLSVMAGHSPLYGIISADAQGDAALAIMVLGLIHAIGVRLNGNWTYSPLLRVFGMGGHAVIMTYITMVSYSATVNSINGITADVFAYSGLALMFWLMTTGAAQDFIVSLKLRNIANGRITQ